MSIPTPHSLSRRLVPVIAVGAAFALAVAPVSPAAAAPLAPAAAATNLAPAAMPVALAPAGVLPAAPTTGPVSASAGVFTPATSALGASWRADRDDDDDDDDDDDRGRRGSNSWWSGSNRPGNSNWWKPGNNNNTKPPVTTPPVTKPPVTTPPVTTPPVTTPPVTTPPVEPGPEPVPVPTPTESVTPTAPAPDPINDPLVAEAGAVGLPTTQIDGVAWAQLAVGDVVYVGGRFKNARPAGSPRGQNETPRSNFLAYDINTGELIEDFAPSFNGDVKALALSADGTTLYVGGMFDRVDGASFYRFVGFDIATGRQRMDIRPILDASVNDIVVREDRVYIGGVFSRVGKETRTKAAALDPKTWTALPWAPRVDGGSVSSLAVSPDGGKVVLAGTFTAINPAQRMKTGGHGAVDSDTGRSVPWAAADKIRSGGSSAQISQVRSDETGVYATSVSYGNRVTHGYEGIFRANWSDGSLASVSPCGGDTYGLALTDTEVYVAGHTHGCDPIGGFPDAKNQFKRAVVFDKTAVGPAVTQVYTNVISVRGLPRGTIKNWYPDLELGKVTGQLQGPWTVETADNGMVLFGGEFPVVNRVAQEGLVRFAPKDQPGASRLPRFIGAQFLPSMSQRRAGAPVQVAVQSNFDQDSSVIRYRLFRDGDYANPIQTIDREAFFWKNNAFTMEDATATPGPHRYRLQVEDSAGNRAYSDIVSYTVR